MIKLYNAKSSTASQMVRLCLAEKHLAYESQWINTLTKEHLTPEYLQINPNGLVPTLVHEGSVVIESSVICEYLDEVFPEIPLSPQTPLGRARMRVWLRFFEEVSVPAVRVCSFHLALGQRFRGLDKERYRREEVATRPLRKDLYDRMGVDGLPTAEVSTALDRLDLTFRRVEGALAGGWLAGETLTIADLALLPLIDRLEDLRLSELWAGCEKVGGWLVRMRERPSVAETFVSGSRVSERLPILPLDVPLPVRS